MDIEEAFKSLDHNFLIFALEKYDFGKSFISWVTILSKNQESYIFNGGTTAKYFLLGRGTLQGDNFSFIYFTVRDPISSDKIKTWD